MLYTHTIGRIGKDCQVITGTHGTFMAVDIAVDDYSKGQNITTWVRVRSSRENHVRLAEYLTKGSLLRVVVLLLFLPCIDESDAVRIDGDLCVALALAVCPQRC